jgi:hypothetical protein
MGLAEWFQAKVTTDSTGTELPEIFPLGFPQNEFVRIDVVNIYTKILTDVLERVHGLEDEHLPLLWDNCLKSSKNDGLITMLAKAMSDKKELFLVYDESVGVIREAVANEQTQIREDYKVKAESDVGVYISFKNYNRSDMVKLYSALEYFTISSLYKNMNLTKAIQFRMGDLRGSVGLSDSAQVIAQAKQVAESLAKGQDVLMDAKDSILTATTDLTSTKASIEFIDAKRSFYLGMPSSYINGEQTGGIGTTGENDTKAVERGLKAYFFSVVKPVLEDIFDVSLSYKSQDFRQVAQALEVIKVFSLVDEELVSLEQKKKIVEGLLDIAPEENETVAPDEIDMTQKQTAIVGISTKGRA